MSAKERLRDRMRQLRLALAAAHRAQDWELAKKLSQQREKVKRKLNRPRCEICDKPINHGGGPRTLCRLHYITNRFYSHALMGWLFALLVVCGCSQPKPVIVAMPPVPPPPPPAPKAVTNASPHHMAPLPMTGNPPVAYISFAWEYFTNSPRYSFNLYAGTNFDRTTWKLVTNVSGLTASVLIDPKKPKVWFGVKARDNVLLLESDWSVVKVK